MMDLNFAAALKVVASPVIHPLISSDWHVTLCFAPCVKGAKIQTSQSIGWARIVEITYWEHVDLTVLILKSDHVMKRHNYYKEAGYLYGLEFIPHVTVGTGDLCHEYMGLIGEKLMLSNEYVRVF